MLPVQVGTPGPGPAAGGFTTRFHGVAGSAIAPFVTEAVVVAVGIGLRLSLLATFNPHQGYDFGDHWSTITYAATHKELPPLSLCRTAYHPPFYYWVAGLVVRFGGGPRAVQGLSIAFGSAYLLLLWGMLRRFLARQPLARLAALALAAVFPASVHLTGMASQEALNNLLALTALALVLRVMQTRVDQRRIGTALALGVVVGLSVLTKMSGLAVLGLVVVAAALDVAARWCWLGARGRPIGWASARWAVALATAGAVSGWWFVHNRTAHGIALPSGWDTYPKGDLVSAALRLPESDRRTVGYYVGWSDDVFHLPYYPAGTEPPRFWPVLLASAFVDYYDYGFRPPASPVAPYRIRNEPADTTTFHLSRASVLGGAAIALLTAAAWLALAARAVRRRSAVVLGALALPLLGVAGQMHFATRYPFEFEGVVKGIYFHFSAAPLYALFGLAVTWLGFGPAAGIRALMSNGPMVRAVPMILTGLAAVAFLAVAAYTVHCAVRP